MRKVVLFFAAAAFLAFVTGGGVACAAIGGHDKNQVNIETVTVTAPSPEVLAKIGATPVTIDATKVFTPEKTVIAETFGAASSVTVFPDIVAEVLGGGVATIAFKAETDKLLETFEAPAGTAIEAGKVELVLWHTNGTDFTRYIHASSTPLSVSASLTTKTATAKADVKTFKFVDADGSTVTKLESGKEVYPLFDVTDNSDEDVNRVAGIIEVRPSAVFAREGSSSGGESGGGCDAGLFGAFGASGAILSLLAGGWLLFKKRGA
jgi:hypothetical protein